MLNVQKYLLENSIEKLEEEYHINVKRYDTCLMLNYNQIDSPRFDSLVDDCRGLIISNDFSSVYCKSFTRFYNFEEKPQQINFNTTYVLEKIDGSLVNLYYNPIEKHWYFATRSMAYAEGNDSFNNTFCSVIHGCFDRFSQIELDSIMFPYIGKTFSFELVSPETKVIKSYGTEQVLYFLGCHENETNEFLSTNLYKFWYEFVKDKEIFSFVKLPQVYNLSSLDEITDTIKTLEATDEGFVVYDYGSKKRFKMKNPMYLEIAHRHNNGKLSAKSVMNLILQNEQFEYLSYFPEDKQIFDIYENAFNKLCQAVDTEFEKHNGKYETRKEMALAIKDNPYKSMIFKMTDTKENASQIYRRMSEENVLNYMQEFL